MPWIFGRRPRSFAVLQNNAGFFMNIITDDFYNAPAAGIAEHFTLQYYSNYATSCG